MPYYKKLVGKKCYLSPRDPDDSSHSAKWLNDVETSMNMSILVAPNELKIRERMEGSLSRMDCEFAIVDLATDEYIGICRLHDIDWVSRSAVFGIVIGEKDYWGKGYGTEATCLILDYGFNILNLETVRLQVKAFNKRGIRAYEKTGFKLSAVQREETYFGQKALNVYCMDILADEFESPYVKEVLRNLTGGE
ncbi:MAG: hypothetical protein A2Y33_13925 [Spirochaetes bacterium GWF1_51_8]|nr:MAG: hypothetical protein A2Y33_13925 [Spirochaetes bacterium GWF1_51_8]